MQRGAELDIELRLRIRHMEDLADASCGIALVFEVLRQRHLIRQRLPQARREIHHARLLWIATREKRTARGIAQRELRVGMLEPHPTRRQRIHPRRAEVCIAIASQFRRQVIDDDEEDARLRRE